MRERFTWLDSKRKYWLRNAVRTRLCAFCGKLIDEKGELHHILAKNQGGLDLEENIVLLHSKCHKRLHRIKKNKKKVEVRKKLKKFKELTKK